MIKVKGILERLSYSQSLHLILKLFTFVMSQDTLEFVGSFVLPVSKSSSLIPCTSQSSEHYLFSVQTCRGLLTCLLANGAILEKCEYVYF